MIDNTWQFWVVFNLCILILILIDLKYFHARAHIVSIKEALWTTAFWVGLALAFNIAIYYTRGLEDALNFFTGYLIEYSLSVDNLFVFLLIFSSFHVPPHLVHKVLFWGIVGAIIMRAVFILSGIALIQSFSWLFYFFGAFLIFTGIKFGLTQEIEIHPEKNLIIRLFTKYFPVTDNYINGNFFIKKSGRLFATPLLVVLLAVETTDLIFAIDSIPAIIGITTDIVIVYTSNIFAVLGLRSLYFALAGMMSFFHYLHYGLAVILVFIGLKMVFAGFIHIPILVTLGFILVILASSIALSLIKKQPEKPNNKP